MQIVLCLYIDVTSFVNNALPVTKRADLAHNFQRIAYKVTQYLLSLHEDFFFI